MQSNFLCYDSVWDCFSRREIRVYQLIAGGSSSKASCAAAFVRNYASLTISCSQLMHGFTKACCCYCTAEKTNGFSKVFQHWKISPINKSQKSICILHVSLWPRFPHAYSKILTFKKDCEIIGVSNPGVWWLAMSRYFKAATIPFWLDLFLRESGRSCT